MFLFTTDYFLQYITSRFISTVLLFCHLIDHNINYTMLLINSLLVIPLGQYFDKNLTMEFTIQKFQFTI